MFGTKLFKKNTVIALGAVAAWSGLGFYRGTQLYDHIYKYECNKYKNRSVTIDDDFILYKQFLVYINSNTRPKYFYSICFGYGCGCALLYLHPFTAPFIVGKEIYRLEVNIRGLEKCDIYYKIF